MPTFEKTSEFPISAASLFAWHSRPAVLTRLTPPWEQVRVIQPAKSLAVGERAIIQVKMGPIWKTWIAEHRRFQEGREFQDVQITGPFAQFEHTHTILDLGTKSALRDAIEYRLPLGMLGQLFGGSLVAKKLERMFRYRHEVTLRDTHQLAKGSNSIMKILVTGATGLVGRELCSFLAAGGHEIYRLVRGQVKEPNDIPWDPKSGTILKARLEGLDAVVHLAGENIAGRRWNEEVKREIRDSRVQGTKLLSEALASLDRPPQTFVCASAIGYYGDRGIDEITEDSTKGTGFLPDVCAEWEAACEAARKKGIRVVNARIGVILSPKGGALSKMLTPFKMGVGGVVGSGKQYWSWIALDDVIGAIHHCLITPEVRGPVNLTAPNPVTNVVFTKTLGGVLHRPTIFPMHAFAARLALGEMANDLLLASNRILPKRLQETGYEFRYSTLDAALHHLLGQ